MTQKELKVVDLADNKQITLKSTSPNNLKDVTRRYILGKIHEKDWVELLRGTFNDALNGDKIARQYLLDQGLGKAPAKIEHTGSIEHNYIKSIDNIKQQATKLSAIHITNDGISEDVS